ncbi:LpqB family beta-propeller domain-containing protein [Aquipuribacter nitratireducens]|uniref:LpqB family beta-propeller domain-containing protein n=1 Tax=Aquipuribacter nitratireducens TaxID=650104 RepID=A0ABW0GP50_9MICO
MTARPPRARAARAVRAVLAVLLGLVLAGCASLPTTGRVVAGGDVDQQGVRPALRVAAAGPVPGADERELVTGFLAAVAGLDDYSVAREFLAPGAEDWRPADRTVVHQGLQVLSSDVEGDEATVRLSAVVVARIDGNGRYVPQSPTTEEQVYRLERVAGEWRISELPTGVLVSEIDADRVLSDFGVWFPDPTGTYLVPDVRWFPQLTSSATSLVRALLAGPSAPYLGALTTAVPEGTRLGLATVPVENGIATVDLTDDVLVADSAQRSLLLSQLRQTLRAVPGVSNVSVTVDGAPLPDVQPEDGLQGTQLRVDPGVDDRPYVLGAPTGGATGSPGEGGDGDGDGDGEEGPDATADPVETEPAVGPDGRTVAPPGAQLLRLDLDGATPVDGTEALTDLVRTGLAASYDGETFAGLDADRTALWVQQTGSPPVELVTGSGLTQPSFDPPPLGWLWTVSADPDGGPPRVLAAASSTEPVEARWLTSGDEVRALRVSRDGTRVVVVVARRDGSVVVEVRGVRRDAGNQPLSLSEAAIRLAPQVLDAVDAAWVGDDQVVVLGRSGEEPLRPFLAQVGGPAQPLAPTPGAVTVSSGLGERSIVVGTSDGTVLRRSGSLWIDGASGVSPAHPG